MIDKEGKCHEGQPLQKNWERLGREGKQEKHRYPRKESFTNEKSKKGIMMGTVARIPTQCYPKGKIVESLLKEAVEWRSIGYNWREFSDVLMKREKRLKEEEEVKEKLRSARAWLRVMKRSIERARKGEREEEGKEKEVKAGVRWVGRWRKKRKRRSMEEGKP